MLSENIRFCLELMKSDGTYEHSVLDFPGNHFQTDFCQLQSRNIVWRCLKWLVNKLNEPTTSERTWFTNQSYLSWGSKQWLTQLSRKKSGNKEWKELRNWLVVSNGLGWYIRILQVTKTKRNVHLLICLIITEHLCIVTQ